MNIASVGVATAEFRSEVSEDTGADIAALRLQPLRVRGFENFEAIRAS